jgi:hypothetical protein
MGVFRHSGPGCLLYLLLQKFGLGRKFQGIAKGCRIPNAVYGKEEAQFSEEIPTFIPKLRDQIPIQSAGRLSFIFKRNLSL